MFFENSHCAKVAPKYAGYISTTQSSQKTNGIPKYHSYRVSSKFSHITCHREIFGETRRTNNIRISSVNADVQHVIIPDNLYFFTMMLDRNLIIKFNSVRIIVLKLCSIDTQINPGLTVKDKLKWLRAISFATVDTINTINCPNTAVIQTRLQIN